ncbi:hypothetical protein AMS68_003498 [Peltaster fructicola]|uniref:ER membrane protein n=1 Tax=Peltaster fructicola TaxID=286661 RepID=A0A6H0XTI9_9PEZI|nr:hypothetical protein AMS68_003498 [Peltaster fructicola]
MILRFFSSTLFLAAIVFTIPLAFDVGGRTCGLAFSLALSTYYFLLSVLRLITPTESIWRRSIVQSIVGLQAIVIPALLIWSLNKFSVDGVNESSWVSRAFYNATKPWQNNVSLRDWLFGREGLLEHVFLGSWDKGLRYSTPVFQIIEGFCSLLVIQAAGQITRYLVNGDGGDGWMIGALIASASIISSSVYFLWRVATFPSLDTQDAVLIGIAITCAFFLCAWGIGSGRGNAIESSLLFAYVTLCIYQIFTDYQPSNPSGTQVVPDPPLATDFPPLPPIIMASFTTITTAFATLPSAIHSAAGFIWAAIATITPSVIISLVYRLAVFYLAARIIPAVRESGARALAESPDPTDHSDGEGTNTIMSTIAAFSPSILIAVYTSLLMQHFASASADHPGEWWTTQGGDGAPTGGNVWRWANLGFTMALYAVELYLGKGNDDALAYGGHWKLD